MHGCGHEVLAGDRCKIMIWWEASSPAMPVGLNVVEVAAKLFCTEAAVPSPSTRDTISVEGSYCHTLHVHGHAYRRATEHASYQQIACPALLMMWVG
jgi:hypothetical protein